MNFFKKGKNDYNKYDTILSDEEILRYALMIDEFKIGKIDFKNLESKMQSIGVVIKPKYKDPSNLKLVERAKEMKERIEHNKPNYSDIECFLMDIADKKVDFRLDYKAIKLLADSGKKNYIDHFIGLLDYAIRHTPDSKKKQELIAEQNHYSLLLGSLEREEVKNSFVGGIYKCDRLYHLVVSEKITEDGRKMVYCFTNTDEKRLFVDIDCSLVTPNDSWQFLTRISDEQLKRELERFNPIWFDDSSKYLK